MPEGGFLPSSPLLLPASEGERWMPAELLEEALPFSEALESSVLPGVLRVAEVPLVRGGVMPTWAVMPLLQEPVWDMGTVLFCPGSSPWPATEEEEEE